MNFEEKIARIEEIVSILDRGEENLDEQIKLYEEGMKLTSESKEYLNKAEQKIIDISNKYTESEE
jgi:exodeoxyribonuclease VII small subunit